MEIDPVNSTGLDLSRRAFVGLSTGIAAVGATIATAGASEEDFGKPHSPIVPENDPGISVEQPNLPRGDVAINGYAAYPKNAIKQTPGIVVTQHVWGVDAPIRDVVRRLAKAGFVTIAPNLYARSNAPSGDGATDYKPFAQIAGTLVDSQADADIAAGATWIRARVKSGPLERPPKVGVMGFCMGGSMALRAAVDDPAFDAAVIFYGKVRWGSDSDEGSITDMALAWADKVRVPLMGNYGARDTGILAADVRAMQGRLRVPNDIKIYEEAGHAFFDDTRKSYVASAASDAWTRTLRWFGKYLA